MYNKLAVIKFEIIDPKHLFTFISEHLITNLVFMKNIYFSIVGFNCVAINLNCKNTKSVHPCENIQVKNLRAKASVLSKSALYFTQLDNMPLATLGTCNKT